MSVSYCPYCKHDHKWRYRDAEWVAVLPPEEWVAVLPPEDWVENQ